MSLFDSLPLPAPDPTRPLAERMRPQNLDEYVGQEHILGPGKPLRVQIERDQLASIILWGPPGVGKTTLANLVARITRCDFVPFSAVLSGIKEIKAVMADAEKSRRLGRRTLIFVDEIHRFNKAQQDAFLPYVERGDIILIGATTENPSFEVVSALLSRAKVYALRSLTVEEVVTLLKRALADPVRGLGAREIHASDELLETIAIYANGDARSAYNILELAVGASNGPELLQQAVEDTLQRKTLVYDKSGEEHFNLISALHKSVRGSDPDAALYYLARMLAAGEDPLFLARRIVRMAIEDVGLADPEAVKQALAAKDVFDFLGSPEGELALAQAVVYVATAPKSNALYTAYKDAMSLARDTGSLMPPKIILNAPTKMMKQQEYGAGYRYDHDEPEAFSGQNYFPDVLGRRTFYEPVERGFEREVKKRLDYWAKLRRERGE